MEKLKLLHIERTYREDIQGIRAIGAILILVFHVWVHKISGGVDVFFVISGFLMTSLLLRQYAERGEVDLFKFWANIIKRIAPSAYIVLLFTLLFGYFFIPSPFWKSSIHQVLYSAVHLENIQLIKLAVDYLAQGTPSSPVQNFWALSIQIQFYLILSAVFIFLTPLNKRVKSLLPLFIVFIVLFLSSFLYSIIETTNSPKTAYFNTLARGWEFFAGSLLALFLPHYKPSATAGRLFGIFGLLILFFGALFIPRGINFPGYIATVPVLSAVMLIVSGSQNRKTFTFKLLSSRWLVAIGGISFTVYLWHWPLLVFYQHYIGSKDVGILEGLILILVSIFLAFLTSKLVEKPFRNIKQKKLVYSYFIGVIFFFPVIAAGMVCREAVQDIQTARIDYWNNKEYGQFESRNIDITIYDIPNSDFISARQILPDVYYNDCHQDIFEPDVISCDYGDVESLKIIALVGGSHAAQWLPALDDIGKKEGIKIVTMTKSSCPFGVVEDSNESCEMWNDNIIFKLNEIRPDIVITNSTRSGVNGSKENIPNSYVDQWRRLEELKIDIVGIRDNPSFGFDVPQCLSINRNDPLRCAISRDSAYLNEDPSRQYYEELSNFISIDVSNQFCTDTICLPAYKDFIIYRDSHHISVPYVRYLTGWLSSELKKNKPGFFESS
ncbi:MAG: acyltransferase family protein [Desulfuromonadales bacterium]|nr:acyltransferase family protein [Desulfuromonadales bacterium]MDW7756248.1 acyltransferase family protein [Desulfuromonadales bacterium]